MRRPLRDDPSPGLTPRRDPVQRLLRTVEQPGTGGHEVSLQLKILTGYLMLGCVLTAALLISETLLDFWWRIGMALGLTLALALSLPRYLARVTRVRVLSRSAFEISQGDLSKPLVVEPPRALRRDEIDELAMAIRRMQENLRELVGKIQDTAKSVADTAKDLQGSAENVNATNEEVGLSMDKIAQGAETQSQLVGKTSKVIT
ncbi:MAG TPA: methyl-accepting chemotaxis protein, partial [Archangium sp.]